MTHARHIPELLVTHCALTDTPEIWLDVSRGLVSPDEAARALAGLESPALIERSKQLFAPPSADWERTMRERLLAEVARPRRRASWMVIGGLVLAAGLALAVTTMRPTPQDATAPLGTTYRAELSAGWEGIRGTTHDQAQPRELPVFRVDQRVSFTLRPNVAIEESELEVVALAYDEAGRGRRIGPARRLPTHTGTVSFTEELGALDLGAGTWRLVFVIGRPGRVPDDPGSFDPEGTDVGGGDHATARVSIRVLDRDGS